MAAQSVELGRLQLQHVTKRSTAQPPAAGRSQARAGVRGVISSDGDSRMNITIRTEQEQDVSSIGRVTEAAFASAKHASGTEAQIVEALRAAGELTISLVAESNGEVVGHVAVSPVQISDGSKNWFGFGPVSVLPEYQRQGVGTCLMRSAIDALRRGGAQGCVLVGDPAYYERFGFKTVPDLILPDVPPEYFLALQLGTTFPVGSVKFHKAFADES